MALNVFSLMDFCLYGLRQVLPRLDSPASTKGLAMTIQATAQAVSRLDLPIQSLCIAFLHIKIKVQWQCTATSGSAVTADGYRQPRLAFRRQSAVRARHASDCRRPHVQSSGAILHPI